MGQVEDNNKTVKLCKTTKLVKTWEVQDYKTGQDRKSGHYGARLGEEVDNIKHNNERDWKRRQNHLNVEILLRTQQSVRGGTNGAVLCIL